MAAEWDGAINGRSRSGRRRRPPMSQINVTPFVDVMLVLLVIFMITAPLLTVGRRGRLARDRFAAARRRR